MGSTVKPGQSKLPPSSVGWWDAPAAILAAILAFLVLRSNEALSDAVLASLLVGTSAIVLGIIEILRAPWRLYKRATRKPGDLFTSVSVKTSGYLISCAAAMFLYWVFPEYQSQYYRPFLEILQIVLPYLPIVAAIYFLFVEMRLPEQFDGPWQAGLFFLGFWRGVDWRLLCQYTLSCLVIVFFLPLSFSSLAANLGGIRLPYSGSSFMEFYRFAFVAIISVELVIVTAGYTFVCRLFDSHIRSTDPTLLGWLSALICYNPFFLLIFSSYLDYRGETVWSSWLANSPLAAIFWGSAILFLMILHLWSDACFGLRFSNLTNRGIITNGPYRFCKHPAYICKNLRWWMVSIPFVSGGTGFESLRLSFLLILVNVLYAVRAYTEERHLSADPAYAVYAAWIDNHGLFSWIGRAVPILSFERRFKAWHDKGSAEIARGAVVEADQRL
jgi:protein-S-isoprenylcysteine O-methyltransferase Ste14